MKNIVILTLFNDMFEGFLNNSIIKRAIAKEIVNIKVVDIRDYTKDKYGRVDTPPVGGGAGLIMKCQPIYDAIHANKTDNMEVILLSPRGEIYNQGVAASYASSDKDIMIICGHYEGIDERINKYVDRLICIGDYILTGGEIPAMAIVDSITRLLKGAISEESIKEESFTNQLLEYPQYTEPYDFLGDKVPDILYCGDHKIVDKYHRKQSLYLTRKYRPDLFDKLELSKQDLELLKEIDEDIKNPSWQQKALQKGHKFIKNKN